MKLRGGRCRYKIPEHSQVLAVYIFGNQRHNQMVSYVLQLCKIEDIGDNKKRGRPELAGVYDDRIEFKPIPDKPYKVTVRYLPPVMEF